MISAHKICWAHSAVSNYGCVSVFTPGSEFLYFQAHWFVWVFFPQLCVAVSVPHTPLITSYDTSNTTKLGPLCWQRTSSRGGGAEQASLAAHWLAQPVLCQGMKKPKPVNIICFSCKPSQWDASGGSWNPVPGNNYSWALTCTSRRDAQQRVSKLMACSPFLDCGLHNVGAKIIFFYSVFLLSSTSPELFSFPVGGDKLCLCKQRQLSSCSHN